MNRSRIAGFALLALLASSPRARAQEQIDWERVPTGETVPLVPSNYCMTYDSWRGVTLLVGSRGRAETWTYDGDAWAQLFPANSLPPSYSYSMAFDSRRGRAVLVTTDWSDPSRAATFEWDGADWSRVTTITAPSARYDAAMAFDERRGVVVLWGGEILDESDTDVWEFDGVAWDRKRAPGPRLRENAACAYDSARGVVVIYGGSRSRSTSPVLFFTETWEWDGEAWTLASESGPFMYSREISLAFDAARGVLLLNDGTTWEWRNAVSWTRRFTETNPPDLQGSAIVYDSRRRRTVLFAAPRWGFSERSTWELSTVRVNCVTPPFGSASGGEIVVLHGFGLDSSGHPIVRFGAEEATVIDARADRIRVRTPLGANRVDVVVVTDHGEAKVRGGYVFHDAAIAARYGNVGAAVGAREDVLFVNGSAGEPALRELRVRLREPVTIEMRAPSSRRKARYALYLWRGEPTHATLADTPFDIGLTIFPTPLSGGDPQPRVIWNNIVVSGSANPLGVPTLGSLPAPSTVFSSDGGAARRATFTLQGFIRDDASGIEDGLSVTNAVVVTIR